MFKTSAIPVIPVRTGEFNLPEVDASIRDVIPAGGVSLSSIITKLLSFASGALHILTLAHGQKVLATDGVDIGGSMAADATLKTMTLRPVVGQEGRTLEFEQVGVETAGFQADVKAAILELINPQRPTFSVGALNQSILAAIPPLAAGLRLAIHVDQAAGTIKVMTYTVAATDAGPIADVAGEDNGINITFPIVPIVEGVSSPNALKFEGGAV